MDDPIISTEGTVLLEVDELFKQFTRTTGPLGTGKKSVNAVNGVSLAVREGEGLGLVGESGSGKSTLARMILLLETSSSGTIRMYGREIGKLDRKARKSYRRNVQAVLQDPYGSLHPRMRARDIIAEPLRIHERLSRRALNQRVADLMEQVGLNSEMALRFPHEFSGGQRQRLAIARALALKPKLIVLDEPVSALDVAIRAQILNLIMDLRRDAGVGYLLVSHDLGVVKRLCQRVAVLYAGKVVEIADSESLYKNPTHPYTQGLLASVPKMEPGAGLEVGLPGDVVDPSNLPAGCSFRPRCKLYAALGSPDICGDVEPELRQIGPDHASACHFAEASSEA